MRRSALVVSLAALLSVFAIRPIAAGSAQTAASSPASALRRAAEVRADIERSRAVDPAARAVDSVLRGRTVEPPLDLEPGQLLTISGSRQVLLQMFFKGSGLRVKEAVLEMAFEPRGLAYDPALGLLAVAAVSKVLLFDVATGEFTVLNQPTPDTSRFGFANDVVFDDRGRLIIADMGTVPSGLEPYDGRIWMYTPADGSIGRIVGNKNLSNPKLLALDASGRIHFVDGEAGPQITPLLDPRYDTVMRIKGNKLKGAKRVWSGLGVLATAFSIAPDGAFWFANATELAIARGGMLSTPCGFPEPFQFVTGLVISSAGETFVLDGADVKTPLRNVYSVTAGCVPSRQVGGARFAGARGLALVPGRDAP